MSSRDQYGKENEMKCERCGSVIDNPETDSIWSGQGDKYTHIKKNDCILALQDARDELQLKLDERPTSETKPERWISIKRFANTGNSLESTETSKIKMEARELLTAHDEVNQLIDMFLMNPTAYINGYPIPVSYFPEKIKAWRTKWS
jgi:hypothetical protein